MDTLNIQTLVAFFKALAHENRLQLIGHLAEREHSVQELAEILNLKAPTVSHHLAMLSELNLVTMRQEGTTHYYRLNNDTLETLRKEMLTREQVATLATESGDAWEEKVRQTFIEKDGRLKSFPSSYKKWLVLLKWFSDRFEFDRRYTEKEVNAIIKQHHEDSASIRRDLIEHRYMARENSVYWRLPPEVTAEYLAQLKTRPENV
jgi:predicted transcriptional regulator